MKKALLVVSFGTTAATPADASQPVNLDSLGSTNGSLTQSGGTLNLGSGGMQLASYTQSGGTLSNSGNTVLNSLTQTGGSLSVGGDLTVNTDFSQGSSGTISVGGNTSISDTSGGAVLGNLSSTGTLTVNSTDGSITQASGTTLVVHGTSNFTASTGTSPNQVPADITLNGASNDFVGTVSANGNNVTLSDVNDLSAILNASGNGTLTAGGDLTVSGNSGDLTTTSGGATSFGGISVNGNLNTTSAGHISQTGPLTVSGTTSLDASGNNVTLNNANNDFVGSVSANGANIALTDANSLTLGNIHASGTLNAAANQNITINGHVDAHSLDLTATHGDISQTNGGTLVVTNGPSNLNAGGDITLGGSNDFNGSVNANGGNITINNINSLTLGNINAANRFDVTAGGNISQDSSNGKKIVVGGLTHITTPGDVVLDGPANQMPQGVVIQARSARVVGDSRKATADAQAKVNGSAPTRTMPGTGLSNTAIPQPLVLVASATSTSTSSSNAIAGAASSSVNSAGVTVDVHNLHQESVPLMVAVSLPKGATTVGTGFTFELPESVQSMPGARESIELTQLDGNTLPAWLKFDQALMRFEASAVPNSALPMQLKALVGGQRVTVVISERTE